MSLLRAFKPKKTKSESARILEIPVREPYDLTDYTGPDLTPEFATTGKMTLRPVQSWALSEIRTCGGCVLSVGVGHGKTLIAYLTPVVLGIDPADVLILVPANLRETFRSEGKKYAKHFRTPAELPLLSYDELSSPNFEAHLKTHQPAVIICDEVHNLRNMSSVRAGRFFDYLRDNPDVTVIGMSGTLFTSSIRDGQPVMRVALKAGSPAPNAWSTLEAWSRCVDVPKGASRLPSARDHAKLKKLVSKFTGQDLDGLPWAKKKTTVRRAFSRRFRTTPGVIHTTETSARNGLHVQLLDVRHIAPELATLSYEIESTWTRPDGYELDSDLRAVETLKQVGLGYYYQWDWGERGYNESWDNARLEYAREMRRFLKKRRAGIDSPALVERAIVAFFKDEPTPITPTTHPDLFLAYLTWYMQADEAAPEAVPVVLSEKRIAAVVKEARAHVKAAKVRGIIWYAFEAERMILEACDVRILPPGSDPEKDVGPVGEVVGMSIEAHGTGKNLQHRWSANWILYHPANGRRTEQLYGRTHRPGQPEDDVYVGVVISSQEHLKAFRSAERDALFIEQTTQQKQKLRIATHLPKKSLKK